MIFAYARVGSYFRPIIPVTLGINSKKFNYFSLIDSGADFTMFHAGIAEILDIDLAKLKKMSFGGIKGGIVGEAFYTAIDIGIGKQYISTPVMFSYEISDNGYGVLGQLGFFSQFKISFDYSKKEMRCNRKK